MKHLNQNKQLHMYWCFDAERWLAVFPLKDSDLQVAQTHLQRMEL